jgi:hypothetical protein
LCLARTSRIDEMSSDYSQRRSYSTTGVIDEKASRNGQIENGSYYVAPKAPSDAGSDSKKRSRSFVRPIIRSAVPNSQLTSIAKRPSQPGHGTKIFIFSFLNYLFGFQLVIELNFILIILKLIFLNDQMKSFYINLMLMLKS